MNLTTISSLLAKDIKNEQAFLHLTPNENVLSDAAKAYSTSDLAGRYNFGPAYEGEKFTLYGGFTSLAKSGFTEVVSTTQRQLSDRLGAADTLFAPLSGLHSMMISVLTLTKVGQTVYSLDPDFGGHFATIGNIEGTGRTSKLIPMNHETLEIDYAAFKEMVAADNNPICVYLDVSYSLIPFDIAQIREIIGDDSKLIFDGSHVIGLIIGGKYPNPLHAGADIITANTHKTLPGSHKGIIACRTQEIFDQVDGPGHTYYSSTHIDHTIALCIAIQEMLEYGKEYAAAVTDNANALAQNLHSAGLRCRKADASNWTYTHQVHLLTENHGDVAQLAKKFFDNNIAVAFDEMFEQGPFIRFGVQEITRRGATQQDMATLATIIRDCLDGKDVRDEVQLFKSKLQDVMYSFDVSA
jgi:glycine/serine hydroxymethyltransferase